MTDEELQALARAAGVSVIWRDASGVERTVSPESLRAVLAALRLDGAEVADLAHDGTERTWRGVIAQAGASVALPPGRSTTARLVREDGATEALTIVVDPQGARFATAPTVPGDHVLELDGRALPFVVAPPRAPVPADFAGGRKLWGAAAQIYALRAERGGAFGDLTALAEAARAFGRRGADALAISPTHALFAADPGRCSPYSPSTRLFANVLFADPAALYPDLADTAGGEGVIDWPTQGRARLATLAVAFERFRQGGADRERAAFAAFCADGGADLEGHARFEALHARFGGAGWRDWPAHYQDANGPAVAEFAREAALEVEFHAFLQWRAEVGLRAAQGAARGAGMALGLIADLAVGMDPNGSHAWSRPHDLLNGLNVGAPPDIYQPAGQDWGLATFSPEALRADVCRPFRATLRAALRHAGGVRIDHTMGLRRLWLVPAGADPGEGAYLSFPEADLLNLVALEAWKAGGIAIGEDLGTVPAGFREATTARGVLGMRVLWFERAIDGGFVAPLHWDARSMATTTTHDLPSVAGWWSGRDIEWSFALGRAGAQADEAVARAVRNYDRERLWSAMVAAGATDGSSETDEVAAAVDAAVAFVAETSSELALVPLEDIAGELEQPNLAGVVEGHPNWRRRLPAPTEALLTQPAAASRIAALNARRPGRA